MEQVPQSADIDISNVLFGEECHGSNGISVKLWYKLKMERPHTFLLMTPVLTIADFSNGCLVLDIDEHPDLINLLEKLDKRGIAYIKESNILKKNGLKHITTYKTMIGHTDDDSMTAKNV